MGISPVAVWVALFVGFISVAFGVKKANANSATMPMNIDTNNPEVTRWIPFVKIAAIAAGFPYWEFPQAWLTIESGGKPCAVGLPKATVPPDGYPQEVGLFQIYNPDDFRQLGVNPGELCAYCAKPTPGTANPQKLLRQMTAQEIGRHIGVGIAFINLKRNYANHYLSLTGAVGAPWVPTNTDYWRMVKLAHALPAIVNTGLGQVVKKLGRPPLSWKEFRTVYETINPRARFNPTLAKQGIEQDGYYRALENAEWTGGQITELQQGPVSS